MKNFFLPIGSIVILKGASKKLMVTGFCIIDSNNSSVVYDYSGCVYPEGIYSSKSNLVFNNCDIDKVIFRGYENEEEIAFKTRISKYISGIGS